MEIARAFIMFFGVLTTSYIIGLRPALSMAQNSDGNDPTPECQVMALGIGLGFLNLLITILALLHALYFSIVGAAISLMLVWGILSSRRYLASPWFQHWKQVGSFERALAILSLAFVFLRVLKATIPTWSSDACLYHLAVPKYFLQHHGIVNLPDIIHSNMNGLCGEMNFLLGYMLAGNVGANVMGPIWCLVGALSLFAITVDEAGRRAGFLAALLYISMPIVFWNSDWQFVDIGAACYSSLFILSIFLWSKSPDRTPWAPALFAGLMVGTKVTTILLAFLGLLWIVTIFFRKSRKERSFSLLLPSLLIFLAVGSFWYIKNWWYTGNPLFPLFLGGKWAPYYIYGKKGGTFYFSNTGTIDYWKNAFIDLLKGGEFGPYFAFVFPLVLSSGKILKKFSWVALPVCGAFMIFTFMTLTWETPVIARFILPYLIFMIIPTSAILDEYFSRTCWERYRLGNILMVIPAIFLLLIEIMSFQSWQVVFREKSKGEFYLKKIPYYAGISYANSKYKNLDRMLYTGFYPFLLKDHPISGTVYQGYLDYESIYGYSEFNRRLKSLDIQYILFDSSPQLEKYIACKDKRSYVGPLVSVYQKQLSLLHSLAESGDWKLDFSNGFSTIYSRKISAGAKTLSDTKG